MKAHAAFVWAQPKLALLAICIGLLGMIGFLTGHNWLLTWATPGNQVAIKPATSMFVVMAGFLAFASAYHPTVRRERLISALASLLCVFVLAVAVAGMIPAMPLEDIESFSIGRLAPSVGVLIVFFSLALSGLMRAVMGWTRASVILSRSAGAIGFAAIAGYIFSVPALYWDVPNLSTSMSVPAAVACVLCCFAMNGLPVKETRE